MNDAPLMAAYAGLRSFADGGHVPPRIKDALFDRWLISNDLGEMTGTAEAASRLPSRLINPPVSQWGPNNFATFGVLGMPVLEDNANVLAAFETLIGERPLPPIKEHLKHCRAVLREAMDQAWLTIPSHNRPRPPTTPQSIGLMGHEKDTRRKV